MRRTARFIHYLGLALFLGSIFSFIVASSVTATSDLAALAAARRVISAGTLFLTLPGLVLLIVSGSVLSATSNGLKSRWVQIMAVAAAVIVVNAVSVVVPAGRAATALAQSSVSTGVLATGFGAAYMTESVAGGVNIVLALIATAAGVWRMESRRPTAA
jgi:hypothetical protein